MTARSQNDLNPMTSTRLIRMGRRRVDRPSDIRIAPGPRAITCGVPRRPALALRALAVALALAAAWTAAAAAPTISIRTRAEVALRSVRRADDTHVIVRGDLKDRATGAGLADQTVRVGVRGSFVVVRTAEDGSFEAVVPAAPGAVDVQLEYEGTSGVDPGGLTVPGVDPTKAPVDFTLAVEPAFDGLLVTVNALVDGAGVSLPVTLRITPADADEPSVERRISTNQQVPVRRRDALGAGSRRLTARFTGDAGHAPASASAVVQLASTTKTTLAFADDELGFDATVRARGRVTDADGTPLPRITVSLLGKERRRLGSAVTDKQGAYAIDVEAELLGAGRHTLIAAAETREAWLQPSDASASITVGAPRPIPIAITIATFVLTAVTVLGFVFARRRREAERRAPVADEGRVHEEPRGGLEVGRASLVSTLRRASDHGFAGTVRDSVRGRPIAGATIVLSLGADARRADSGEDGRFALEQLAPGEWTARVAAPGHVAERFAVGVPHRGELRGVRVDLVPVRERVFSIYRHAALPLLPRPELWGVWSPRQIVDHVRAQRPPVALAALTSFVEEVYFSGRVSDEVVLVEAEAKAADVITERAAAGLAARA